MVGAQSHEMTNAIWTASELEQALGVPAPSGAVTSVSIDTRTLEPGALFIGLPGENTDGGQFAAAALSKGAALCILRSGAQMPQQYKKQCIFVPDTMEALNQLARVARARAKGKIIGVTGSVGKTSTKEMLRLVLSNQGQTYANYGTYNNHYGVPLSLANTPAEAEYAIFEMGINHPGELRTLSHLVRPHVALVTTVAPAHLEFFSSISAIAAAKAEIFEGVLLGGQAIIDLDNPYHQILAQVASNYGVQIIGFSHHIKSRFRLLSAHVDNGRTMIQAECNGRLYDYSIPVLGMHWAKLSVAVLAVVWAIGADITSAMYQLQYFTPPAGRGIVHQVARQGITVIDDAYNANPTSVTAAMAVLGQHRAAGKRTIAVLGDMRELGPKGPALHEELALAIEQNKIDLVYTVGELMYNLYQAIPEKKRGCHCDTAADLARVIINHIQPDDIILVKGSKSMQMGKVLSVLLQP